MFRQESQNPLNESKGFINARVRSFPAAAGLNLAVQSYLFSNEYNRVSEFWGIWA